MSSQYLFIDGGYLRSKFEKAVNSFFDQSESKPDYSMLDLRRVAGGGRKIFYYDCFDYEQRKSETASEFNARITVQDRAVHRFRRSCQLRLGTLKGKGNRRRQKQVDVMLAVDMLTQGFRENFDHAKLLAGDLDFKPVVESLVHAGHHVELWCCKSGTSEELIGVSDTCQEFDLRQLVEWVSPEFKKEFEFPSLSYSPPSGVITVNHISPIYSEEVNGHQMAIYEVGKGRFEGYFYNRENSHPLKASATNPGILKRMFAAFGS